MYDEYGPTARLCLNFVTNLLQLSSYRSCRANEINELSIDYPMKVVQQSCDSNMDASHSVFLVRREDVTNLQEFVVALNLVPVVKLPLVSRKVAQLKSLPSSTTPNLADSLVHILISIRLKPVKTIDYEGSTLREVHSDILYVPKSLNQVVFNLFILAD